MPAAVECLEAHRAHPDPQHPDPLDPLAQRRLEAAPDPAPRQLLVALSRLVGSRAPPFPTAALRVHSRMNGALAVGLGHWCLGLARALHDAPLGGEWPGPGLAADLTPVRSTRQAQKPFRQAPRPFRQACCHRRAARSVDASEPRSKTGLFRPPRLSSLAPAVAGQVHVAAPA